MICEICGEDTNTVVLSAKTGRSMWLCSLHVVQWALRGLIAVRGLHLVIREARIVEEVRREGNTIFVA